MKILGLHDGHGASIAALVDGSIIKSFEEERFSRLKGDSGFPKLAIDFLKEEMPAFFSQLDYVAVPSFQVEYNLLATKRYPKFSVRDFLLENDRFWIPVLDEGKKINYVDAMAEYIDFDICHYPFGED